GMPGGGDGMPGGGDGMPGIHNLIAELRKFKHKSKISILEKQVFPQIYYFYFSSELTYFSILD
ncbi:MAG: hypothetical protein ACE5FF_15555, partial [Saprospiraceae bacterium]